MEELYLIEPSKEYKESFEKMVKDYEKNGEEEYYNMHKVGLDDFEAYVDKLLNNAKGINLPKDRVASSTYWLVNKNKEIVGCIRIRKELNSEILRNIIGHIGYDISPSNRRRGYGELILKLGIEEAKKMNVIPLLITCKEDNYLSRKVIEKNGGVFESEILDSNDDIYRRYWIGINE